MTPWLKKSMALSASLACAGVLVLGATQLTPAEAGPPIKGSGLPFSEELADPRRQDLRRQEPVGEAQPGHQACNGCHSSAWGFTGRDAAINAGGAVYEGSVAGRFGDRKPSSSAYSSLPPIFGWTHSAGGMFIGGNFWDGRATGEKLGNPAADQAQGPFLNSKEQALRDSACVVYRVSTAEYSTEYKRLWGNAIESTMDAHVVSCGQSSDRPRNAAD